MGHLLLFSTTVPSLFVTDVLPEATGALPTPPPKRRATGAGAGAAFGVTFGVAFGVAFGVGFVTGFGVDFAGVDEEDEDDEVNLERKPPPPEEEEEAAAPVFVAGVAPPAGVPHLMQNFLAGARVAIHLVH